MEYDLLDYNDLLRKFIAYLESNCDDLVGKQNKTRATLIEKKLRDFLQENVEFKVKCNSVFGVDFPNFNTDIKCTSVDEPQSSSPYRSISEKFFGLDYNILLIMYNEKNKQFKIERCVYIPKHLTGCKNGTRLLKKLTSEVKNNKLNKDISIRLLKAWLFSVEDISSNSITRVITNFIDGKINTEALIKKVNSWNIIEPLDVKPNWDDIWVRAMDSPIYEGVINYSPALQWRLQYRDLTKDIYPKDILGLK